MAYNIYEPMILAAVDLRKTIEPVWVTITETWNGFMASIPLIIAGVIILVITKFLSQIFSKSANKILHRFTLLESQKTLLTRLGCIGIWVLGISVSVMIVFPDITPGKFLAGLGIGSVAIGFAFKDIFENFFAGILILWSFPFENGDVIECQGTVGTVEDVTIRNTFLRKASGELVVMPNSTIFMNCVDVLTDQKLRRVSVTTGIAYGEDVDAAREIIRKAVAGCPSVSDDKPVDVFAKEFASSSVDFNVFWWTDAHPAQMAASRDEGIAAIKSALDTAGIEIPFPYTTLTFKEPLNANVNSTTQA